MNRVMLNNTSLDGGAIVKGRAAGASDLFIIPADGVLPETGKENKIYLIPNSGSEGNLFDEFVYANGAWEKVGTIDFVVDQYLDESSTNAVSNQSVATEIFTIYDTLREIKKELPSASVTLTSSENLLAVATPSEITKVEYNGELVSFRMTLLPGDFVITRPSTGGGFTNSVDGVNPSLVKDFEMNINKEWFTNEAHTTDRAAFEMFIFYVCQYKKTDNVRVVSNDGEYYYNYKIDNIAYAYPEVVSSFMMPKYQFSLIGLNPNVDGTNLEFQSLGSVVEEASYTASLRMMEGGFYLISSNNIATESYVDTKISQIPEVIVDTELNAESTNPISNKAVAEAIASAITSTLNTEV